MKKDNGKSKGKRVIFYLFVALISIVVMIVTLAVIAVAYVKSNISMTADLSEYYRACGENITEFYCYERDSKGNILYDSVIKLENSDIYSSEKRLYAPYDTIPEDLIYAFVAIEDKRFFEHNGIDWYRTIGAAANYLFHFRDGFGASTITQQLVKNVTGNDSYSIKRKLQEIFYAQSLEKQLDKEEILELYLNIVNLSRGCLGVRTAALTYFSKELAELDLGECACLAAITQNPSYYDPYSNPENNKYRRNLILDMMLQEGYITEEEHGSYYGKDVTVNMSDRFESERINSWYVDMVIDDVCRDLCDSLGYSYEEAESLVYTGGLKIYTLVDPPIQAIVERYYSDESNFPDSDSAIKAQSSIIIIDPDTGDILGVAGGRGEKSGNRIQNYATQTLRPSGSVVKPLSVYATALEDRLITYASVFDDVPVNFGDYNTDPQNGDITEPRAWPKNAPNVYHGLVNVNYSIEVSLNTVAVKVLELVGKERAFYFLKDSLGMKSLIEELTLENGAVLTDMDVASLALGQMNYGVTVREITSAYTSLAGAGVYSKGRSYTAVTDSEGRLILENKSESERVISRDNSVIMTQMLQNVVDNGTAKGITLDKSISVAGKTGTSQDYYDRWFIGYTPYYLGGIWYGYEYPKSLESNTQYICTKIWNEIMIEIHELYGYEDGSFSESENVITVDYCCDSGKLLTAACLLDPRGIRAERGYFVKGTEPTEYCDCHILVEYDKDGGGVAIGSCSKKDTVTVGMIQVERSFPIQIYISDAQYVWRPLEKGVLPTYSDSAPFFSGILGEGEYSGISNTDVQFNRACGRHKSIDRLNG